MQLRNGKNTTSGPVPQGAGDTSWEMRVAIVREQCRRQIEERNQAKIEYYESLVRGALTGEGWPADEARCPYVSDEEQDEGRYSYVNDAEDWGSDWDDDDPWVRDEEQDEDRYSYVNVEDSDTEDEYEPWFQDEQKRLRADPVRQSFVTAMQGLVREQSGMAYRPNTLDNLRGRIELSRHILREARRHREEIGIDQHDYQLRRYYRVVEDKKNEVLEEWVPMVEKRILATRTLRSNSAALKALREALEDLEREACR